MATLPQFITLKDIEKKTAGKYTVSDVLALASNPQESGIALCVLLDPSDKVSHGSDPFGKATPNKAVPECKQYKTDSALVTFNETTKSSIANGLFFIPVPHIQRLLTGKPFIKESEQYMPIAPYPIDNGITVWLDKGFFGNDVLSRLVLPRAEMEKLIEASHPAEDAGKSAVSEKQDDTKGGSKERSPRADVKRVTDVIQAWEGIRALRKGREIDEILDNLPNDKELVEEIERTFEKPISKSQCYNILNVIKAYKDNLA